MSTSNSGGTHTILLRLKETRAAGGSTRMLRIIRDYCFTLEFLARDITDPTYSGG
jgi:hypothetical protein